MSSWWPSQSRRMSGRRKGCEARTSPSGDAADGGCGQRRMRRMRRTVDAADAADGGCGGDATVERRRTARDQDDPPHLVLIWDGPPVVERSVRRAERRMRRMPLMRPAADPRGFSSGAQEYSPSSGRSAAFRPELGVSSCFQKVERSLVRREPRPPRSPGHPRAPGAPAVPEPPPTPPLRPERQPCERTTGTRQSTSPSRR